MAKCSKSLSQEIEITDYILSFKNIITDDFNRNLDLNIEVLMTVEDIESGQDKVEESVDETEKTKELSP